MDVALLSRIQFAVTVGFHFLFPPITIGLAWMLVAMEWKGWRRNSETYRQAGRFFGKLLGLTFAVGVATGIVMEFQFGTNWSRYSKFVGDIFGAPLAAEGVLAFFLESTFLGVYLFARNRISKGWHWFSILMVAVGATLSAFWIIVANSWMQTPAGYSVLPLREGVPPYVPGTPADPTQYRAVLTDFWAAVFNPSTLVRYFHTVTAAVVCGAFFVAGAGAYILLRVRKAQAAGAAPIAQRLEPVQKAVKVALVLGLVFALLVMFPFGHMHAQQVAHTQPEKFAAIEGLYRSQHEAPLVLFALPNEHPPELKARVEIPNMLSMLVFGEPGRGHEIKSLDQFPPDRIPPLWLTFVSFHNMVLLGIFFFVVLVYGLWRLRGGKIWQGRRFLWVLVACIPLSLAACQFGWVTAEVGRQPFIVYDFLRTSDAFSSNLSMGHVWFSLLLLGLIYTVLLALYLFLLVRKLRLAAAEITGAGKPTTSKGSDA